MKREIRYCMFMLAGLCMSFAAQSQPAEYNTGNYWQHPGGQKYINMNFINTGVWINNGAVWYMANFTNNATVDYSETLSVNTGISHFEGNLPQTISGTGQTRFYSVLFSNQQVSGAFKLQQDIRVVHQADFTNGIVTALQTTPETYLNKVIMENGASSVNVSDNSFVDGYVNKIGNTAFTFPIGNGNYYRFAAISAPSTATDEYAARYINADPASFGYDRTLKEDSLLKISNKEYWIVNRVNGSSNIQLTLSWDVSKTSATLTANISKLRIARWNGSKWLNEGNIATTGSINSGTITAKVSGYGVFTLSVTELLLTARLDPSSDSGVKGDSITNITTPVISGTGEPGCTITVTTPTGEVLTTTVDNDGNWHVVPKTPLPEGPNTIKVVETDSTGNSTTTNVVVIIDTTPPLITINNPIKETDNQISGTTDPNTKVTVTFPDGTTETTTSDANGNWSVPVNTPLHEGDLIIAQAVDEAGNVGSATTTVGTDDIFIPNGFSPNNDQHNDCFKIRHGSQWKIGILVFNRWGNKVYSSDDYQNDWDGKGHYGTLLGKNLPDGTYYYIVTAVHQKTNEKKQYSGYITLRRD